MFKSIDLSFVNWWQRKNDKTYDRRGSASDYILDRRRMWQTMMNKLLHPEKDLEAPFYFIITKIQNDVSQEVTAICKCHINRPIDTVLWHNCINYGPKKHFTCRFLSHSRSNFCSYSWMFVNSEIWKWVFYAWEMLRMDWPGNSHMRMDTQLCYSVFNLQQFHT